MLSLLFAHAGAFVDRVVRRFMPAPFVLVLGLTLLAFVLGLATMQDVPGTAGSTVFGKGSSLVRCGPKISATPRS